MHVQCGVNVAERVAKLQKFDTRLHITAETTFARGICAGERGLIVALGI